MDSVIIGGRSFTEPFWTVSFRAGHESRGLPTSVVVMNSSNYGSYFPLFSDRASAEQAIAAEPTPEKVAVSIDFKESRRCLRAFLLTGSHYVGIDTSLGHADSTWVPVTDVLAALARA